jgi:hypothetical protein
MFICTRTTPTAPGAIDRWSELGRARLGAGARGITSTSQGTSAQLRASDEIAYRVLAGNWTPLGPRRTLQQRPAGAKQYAIAGTSRSRGERFKLAFQCRFVAPCKRLANVVPPPDQPCVRFQPGVCHIEQTYGVTSKTCGLAGLSHPLLHHLGPAPLACIACLVLTQP